MTTNRAEHFPRCHERYGTSNAAAASGCLAAAAAMARCSTASIAYTTAG
jgi:hypothetical protein